MPSGTSIVDCLVAATDYSEVASTAIALAAQSHPYRVHAANVHMVMEAYDDPAFQEVVNSADINTPDGMPLVWALKLLGHPEATRVYGPTLMLHVCEAAAREGIPVGLYGGTDESLLAFREFLHFNYPGIRIAYSYAPPFRPLTTDEDTQVVQDILTSGARILFVGIGCPKQEWWMYDHRDRLPLVMLGVGAAFDFHTGRVRQAPAALQGLGLEWLFRLAMEPKRLWKRYAKHNPRFVVLFGRQLFRERVLGLKGEN